MVASMVKKFQNLHFLFPGNKIFSAVLLLLVCYERIWKIDELQGEHDSYESYSSYRSDSAPGTAPNAGSVTFGRLWQPLGWGCNGLCNAQKPNV